MLFRQRLRFGGEAFSAVLRLVLRYSVALVVLFMAARAAFAVLYVSEGALQSGAQYLPHALLNGLRFDLQVAAYAALLPSLLVLWCAFLPAVRGARAFSRAYYTVVGTLLALLSVIDLGFYSNFHSHIHLTFFDFLDEGPRELLVAIWDEYPVVWLALLLVVVAILFYALGHQRRPAKRRYGRVGQPVLVWPRVAAVVVYAAVVAVCLRGSVGRFPLQVEDLVVSPSEHINNLVPNAPYMLKKALKEKSQAFQFRPACELEEQYGFQSLQEALDAFTDGRVALTADTLRTLEQALYATAPVRPDSLGAQPNVVILCCESWSGYLLQFNAEGSDLLCGLQRHLGEDIVMRQFQSVRNATIATLENVSVATPFPRVFRSQYRMRQLPTSLALPFAQSGYTCEFISGMDKAWENCGASLLQQGFERITSKYELLQELPEATANSIGVYDEYMLQALLRHLNAPAKKPQMIFGITTTNHPPFELPEQVQLPALSESLLANPCFNDVGRDVLQKYLRAFQYSNQALARFLTAFKQSPAAQNTVLILTGDHNIRSILNADRVGEQWAHAVPLYIYLPQRLRPAGYPQQPQGWGSHYDIAATVAPLAFSGTRYLRLGRNLLQSAAPDRTYSYNEQQLLCAPAYRTTAQRKALARELLLTLYFQMVLR